MLSVLDTPKRTHYDEHVETPDLTIERPQPRHTRPGFRRMLARGITTYLTQTPRVTQAPLCRAPRPFESPMDRLVREYPSLAPLALAII